VAGPDGAAASPYGRKGSESAKGRCAREIVREPFAGRAHHKGNPFVFLSKEADVWRLTDVFIDALK